MQSSDDVDLQLIDASDGTEIVKWPGGLLDGPTAECVIYLGVKYCYSGYNGIDGEMGNEYIELSGTTNRPLTVQVYGYASGAATVIASSASGPISADCTDQDNDGDVDQEDFGQWQRCVSGDAEPRTPSCTTCDIDDDDDVDQDDLNILLGCLNGANVPIAPGCAN
jgi:hypothetical protein